MSTKDILQQYKQGDIELTDALQQLSDRGIVEMGFATIDSNRLQRTGLPEVIYASGKTVEQVAQIAERMYQNKIDILATRATPEMFEAVKKLVPGVEYNELAKTITYKHTASEMGDSYIVVVAAGTSDMPVAEEAAVTARFLNNRVETIYDVGVAGIHRLFNKLEIGRASCRERV